jgi:hypothetical protein
LELLDVESQCISTSSYPILIDEDTTH